LAIEKNNKGNSMNKKLMNIVTSIFVCCALWCSLDTYTIRRKTTTVTTVKKIMVDEVEPNLEGVSIDLKAKRQSVIRLVERAKKYLATHSLDESCMAFTHTKQFVDGESSIFLFDIEGVCFAHPEKDLLWKNMKNFRSEFGRLIIADIIELAKVGGGWTNYQWRKATQTAWIQKVVKDGRIYVMGAGYYSHSKEESVVNIVKAAVALFNVVKTRGQVSV